MTRTEVPTWENPLWFGKWRIYATDPRPPIPTWQQFAFSYTHDDYDGAPDAGDSRHGFAANVAECIAEVADLEAEDCQCSAPCLRDCMALACPVRLAIAQALAA